MKRYAEPLAYAERGGHIESEHFGYLAVCDSAGRVVVSRGNVDRPVFLRSSAKPFQAIACVLAGAADHYAWNDEELAVICASHAAEDFHLQAVRQILDKAELREDQLGCGPHAPFSETARDRLFAAGLRPSRIHNNCSGKHAGMLATCIHQRWDRTSYLSGDHPLQQTNLRTLCRFADSNAGNIPAGVDGCGVPTFQITIAQTATAFARLTNPERLGDDDRTAARRVVQAMASKPKYLAGSKIFNTTLMEFAGGRVVAKLGAEGVFGIGLPGLDLGIALKIADGSPRVHPVVVIHCLRRHLPDLPWDEFSVVANPPITNTRGETVGFYRAAD